MSRWPLDANGAVRLKDGGTITYTHNGFGFTSLDEVSGSGLGAGLAEASVHNGLSLTASGRVRMASSGTVAYVHGGLAFDSTNRLLTTNVDPGASGWHNGVKVDASGKLYAVLT